MGNDFEIVLTGAEGLEDGYNYEQFGLTLVFEHEEPYKIAFIECNELADFNGARLGMTSKQIMELLGEEENRRIFK